MVQWLDFTGCAVGKEPAANAGDSSLIPGSGRSPWLPTPVFLLREFHGQRSLVGYSPQGHKDLDMTERLSHSHLQDFLLFCHIAEVKTYFSPLPTDL